MVDSPSSYRHDCLFCEETIEGATLDAVREEGSSHLETRHAEEFERHFREKLDGRKCLDECGYTFPGNGEVDAGLTCPNCGHDNFAGFAQRHVWWRAEVE